MRFFLRPGAIKAQLQPVICAGGGVVCKMQEPNAILLMAPEEMNEVPVSTALQYVSSQYILDCVEKNEQLEVDDYRFRNDRVQTRSARPKREGTGRMGYTAEEDAAILRFVRGRKQEVCGNSLWKQMAREAITSHSWQSMKDRYRQPHSLAVEGSSVGKDVAGPNVTSTGTNGQLVVTGQVLEEQEQRITPKKRTLGVLEMAMKEFEDLDESEDDTPDIDLSSTAGADCSGLDEEIVAASSAEVIQENDDDDDDDDANMDDAEPQPEKSPDIQLAPPDEDGGPEVSGPAPKTPAPLTSAPVTSKVHRFLFDRESQEEEPPQPACDPPFTQAQLEEARQQLRYLMKESGQGLDNVTKALLKNSGDVEAALQYLRHGPQGYLWDPRDDGLLRSGGPSLHILEQKYGKVAVARRIAFLEIQ
ncbi:hypothetical protein ANANG_G00248800 [Anguilla anguilla]|uniref:Telomeric repeat-binding factor 2-interacting protein 1 n=1 Tax=Anguilla anguilla TaxID=7936 RepID=A0A9D3LRY9_ANGAN|nr:hypothetical protein ANANG_G00248800 [Anguilla anguilla]